MRRPVVAMVATLLLAALCAPVPAAGSAPGGAVTYLITTAEGTSMTKLFYQEHKLRIETQADPAPEISILRLDLRIAWALDPSALQCHESGLEIGDWYAYRPSKAFLKHKTNLGEEKVLDRACAVYEYKIGSMKVKAWIDPNLGLVLKGEFEKSGKIVNYEAIEFVPGDQPNSLFQIPAGFSKKVIKQNIGGGGGCGCGG